MSKFKLPAARTVDEWVGADQPPAKPPKQVMARLTIDLPVDLHSQFKAACAINKTRMVDEVTRFIADWTQKHR